MAHLLDIKSLAPKTIEQLLDKADDFLDDKDWTLNYRHFLKGCAVANLFFESSTRTRISFELAAHYLGADVINVPIDVSAINKGETIIDTLHTLEAMGISHVVMRHGDDNAAHDMAQQLSQPSSALINAGSGRCFHPTQALLDALTIRRHKKTFSNLCVAIIGDVLHSRVASSLMTILQKLGVVNIRWVGPERLLPTEYPEGVCGFHQLEEGLNNADVVVALRLQKERMQEALIPNDDAFFTSFGLTEARLQFANPDAIVMHPGPINRGIEIASEVADGPQSTILEQVRHGVAIRMAVLDYTQQA